MLFSKPHPIYDQIDEYTLWRSARYPYVAGAEGSLLKRFARAFKLTSVEDITVDMGLFFAGQEVSHHFTAQTLVAIRGFLRYCKWAGYPCIDYKTLDIKSGRPRNMEMEKEVRIFKNRGMTPYQIHRILQDKFPTRKIHRTSVYRWAGRAGEA